MTVAVRRALGSPTTYRVMVDGRLIDSRLTKTGAMAVARAYGKPRYEEWRPIEYKASPDPCTAPLLYTWNLTRP